MMEWILGMVAFVVFLWLVPTKKKQKPLPPRRAEFTKWDVDGVVRSTGHGPL